MSSQSRRRELPARGSQPPRGTSPIAEDRPLGPRSRPQLEVPPFTDHLPPFADELPPAVSAFNRLSPHGWRMFAEGALLLFPPVERWRDVAAAVVRLLGPGPWPGGLPRQEHVERILTWRGFDLDAPFDFTSAEGAALLRAGAQ